MGPCWPRGDMAQVVRWRAPRFTEASTRDRPIQRRAVVNRYQAGGAAGSHRFFAAHGGPVHLAAMALIVVVSLVDAKPVVPRDHHVRLPAQPAAKGVLGEVFGEVVQNGRTFRARQSFDADSI